MKNIIITGQGSYVGTSLKLYLQQFPGRYRVEELNMHGSQWRSHDFSPYDCVFHTAGIAHVDTSKLSAQQKADYNRVNIDLAVAAARKAKAEGVRQFIFMSSILVYGDSAPLGADRMITAATKPHPTTYYGRSKREAEKQLTVLEGEDFQVAILRAPMIYGAGCKGNFRLLEKLAERLPVFPKVENGRSMVYIENLCELVRLLVEHQKGGIFLPQNREVVRTSELVRELRRARGKKVFLTRMFAPALWMASRMPGRIGKMVGKAFGNLAYAPEASRCEFGEYQRYGLRESIERLNGKEKKMWF